MATMTLHTLKSIADHAPEGNDRVPGLRQLQKSGSGIVVRSLVTDMLITVYQNGYVSCQRGTANTVFRLHDCGGYYYQTVHDENAIYLPETMFENEIWYIRLFLEGEDRLNKNQERMHRKKTIICSGKMTEYMDAFSDSRAEGLRTVLEREAIQQFQEYFSRLSGKQQLAVRLYCMEGLSLEDCAVIYGASSRAVSQALHRAIPVLLSMYGISADKIALSYHRSRTDDDNGQE